MDKNAVICLMWVAGFFQGLGLGIAFFPNLSTKRKNSVSNSYLYGARAAPQHDFRWPRLRIVE